MMLMPSGKARRTTALVASSACTRLDPIFWTAGSRYRRAWRRATVTTRAVSATPTLASRGGTSMGCMMAWSADRALVRGEIIGASPLLHGRLWARGAIMATQSGRLD